MSNSPFQIGEAPGTYITIRPITDEDILVKARQISGRRLARGRQIKSPDDIKDYIGAKMADVEHEVFCCIFMDVRNRILKYDEMFRGSIAEAAVYPREVVKLALNLNAASVIFIHNHPSGDPQPSEHDIKLTKHLIQALELIDVKVLDHLIIGADENVSFAQLGLI